jgi:hypothetical protein
VSLPVATIPLISVEAAEECLTKPKELTPPGQHWYYLIDRGSKRRCWYLHKETGTSSHASITRRARRAAIVDARNSEPAITRASADAYAEFGLPSGRDDNAPQVSQQTLVASDYPKRDGQDRPDTVSGATAQSPVAARWPEPAGIRSTVIEPPPAASFAVATITPDVTPEVGTADLAPKTLAPKDLAPKDLAPKDLAPKAPLAALTSAETPATGTSTSLETLLLATLGAMTLTGFAGSSVYLLSRPRRQPQALASLAREPVWPPPDPVHHTRLPQWLDPAASASTRYRDRARDAQL